MRLKTACSAPLCSALTRLILQVERTSSNEWENFSLPSGPRQFTRNFQQQKWSGSGRRPLGPCPASVTRAQGPKGLLGREQINRLWIVTDYRSHTWPVSPAPNTTKAEHNRRQNRASRSTSYRKAKPHEDLRMLNASRCSMGSRQNCKCLYLTRSVMRQCKFVN